MSTTAPVITCDACEQDLTYTTNAVDYRIVLASETLTAASSVVTLALIEDPLPQSKHFCGMTCLRTWAARTA